MEKKKITWRLSEVDFHRVAEAESWLSERAEQGLMLQKAGKFLCRFEKTTPRQVRFRLEPRGKDDPSDEYIEACAEMGWEFVDCWRSIFLIWKCERTDLPEFHTDPVAESYAFRRLSRSMMWNAIISIVGVIIMTGLLIFTFKDELITQLIQEERLSTWFLFFSFLWVDLEALQQWFSIRRLTKMLRSGEDIHGRIKVTHRLNWLPETLYLISAVIVLVAPFYAIGQSRTGPADRFELSVPRLCEIEEGVIIEEGLTINGIDYGNYVHSEWSFLAPEMVELTEQGRINESDWEEWHKAGRPESEIPISYEAKYYRLRFEFLTKPLLDETVANLSDEMDIAFEKVDGGDEAWYGAKENIQHLLIRRGNEVVHLRYRGTESLRDRMDILLAKLGE